MNINHVSVQINHSTLEMPDTPVIVVPHIWLCLRGDGMNNNNNPFNPYYLALWYFAIVSFISIVLIAADTASIHALYLFLQSHGVASMVLGLRRYNSMHQYLIGVGDISRWEAIVCYLSYAVSGLTVSMAVTPFFLLPFVRAKAAWNVSVQYNRPMSCVVMIIILFGTFILFYQICFVHISTWTNLTFGYDKMHVSSVGYFITASLYSLLLTIYQVILTLFLRLYSDVFRKQLGQL